MAKFHIEASDKKLKFPIKKKQNDDSKSKTIPWPLTASADLKSHYKFHGINSLHMDFTGTKTISGHQAMRTNEISY
jgi:hypothetical protein